MNQVIIPPNNHKTSMTIHHWEINVEIWGKFLYKNMNNFQTTNIQKKDQIKSQGKKCVTGKKNKIQFAMSFMTSIEKPTIPQWEQGKSQAPIYPMSFSGHNRNPVTQYNAFCNNVVKSISITINIMFGFEQIHPNHDAEK